MGWRVGAGLGLRNFRSIMTFFRCEYKSFNGQIQSLTLILQTAQETNGCCGFFVYGLYWYHL